MIRSIDYKQIAKTGGLVLAGLILGWLLFGGSSTGGKAEADIDQHVEEVHTDEQGNIVYTCSMHPNIRQNEPGNCPICGMELIPASDSGESAAAGTGASGDDPYTLTMTHAAMKLAEVQTSTVTMGPAVTQARMPGKVVADERRISSVTAHFPGRIKQLYVDFTGERVSRGQRLASIYSPELLTAQRELLEAQKFKTQNPALYQAARRKLMLWELPDEEINRIESSGEVLTEIDIVSPVDGYVLKRNVSTQDHVMEGSIMYRIANLERVWIVFNAYESDLMGLEVGNNVEFRVDAYPGENFHAEISYIDPVLDPETRTVSVRAETFNRDNMLKPQMLVEGIVSSTLYDGEHQVLVPKSSVLWTGERSVVYVMKPNTAQPAFEFREVVLGPRVGDRYVVKSGVEAGEEVVTNGNFKIDSAAQLAGKTSMMNRNADAGRSMPAGHDHGSMEMELESGTEQPMQDQQEHQH